MKFLPSLLAALAVSGLTATTAFADASGVLLRVEQNNTSDMNPKDRYSKTQKHSLKIYLTNSSSNPADLKAKYTYFGRDMQTHDVVVIHSGEVPVAMKTQGENAVDLPPATSQFTEEHIQPGPKGKPGTKVDASGARFVGYAVQIYAGGTLAAESYEPASMKEEIGKAAPMAKAGTAAKPAATPKKN